MGLGAANYESGKGYFPPGRLTPDWARNGAEQGSSNYSNILPNDKTGFYSVHIWLLPYMEASNVYNLIKFDVAHQKILVDSAGNPANNNYAAYATAQNMFICPTDPHTERIISENNYRANFGGTLPSGGARSSGVYNPRSSDIFDCGGNGAFSIGKVGLKAKTYTDGLSKTAFFSERTKGSALDENSNLPTLSDIVTTPGRGGFDEPNFQVQAFFDDCAKYQPSVSEFNNPYSPVMSVRNSSLSLRRTGSTLTAETSAAILTAPSRWRLSPLVAITTARLTSLSATATPPSSITISTSTSGALWAVATAKKRSTEAINCRTSRMN
jgi:hypothetical protein